MLNREDIVAEECANESAAPDRLVLNTHLSFTLTKGIFIDVYVYNMLMILWVLNGLRKLFAV